MKLGEFIEKFSHNNVVRLLYKNNEGSHVTVGKDWNDCTMDWEINQGKGNFRHYINNEVLSLACIGFMAGDGIHHSEALNIVIEKLEEQPYIAPLKEEEQRYEACGKL